MWVTIQVETYSKQPKQAAWKEVRKSKREDPFCNWISFDPFWPLSFWRFQASDLPLLPQWQFQAHPNLKEFKSRREQKAMQISSTSDKGYADRMLVETLCISWGYSGFSDSLHTKQYQTCCHCPTQDSDPVGTGWTWMNKQDLKIWRPKSNIQQPMLTQRMRRFRGTSMKVASPVPGTGSTDLFRGCPHHLISPSNGECPRHGSACRCSSMFFDVRLMFFVSLWLKFRLKAWRCDFDKHGVGTYLTAVSESTSWFETSSFQKNADGIWWKT